MVRSFLILLYRHQISAIVLLFALLMALGGISKGADLIHTLDRGIVIPGHVERIIERQPDDPKEKPKFVPVLSYTTPSGDRREFEGPAGSSARFEAGKEISVIFDPKNPGQPLLKLPLFEQGFEALMFLVVASLLNGFAALVAFRRQDISAFFRDRTFDEQRFAPVTGLLDGVAYIKQGRYPLELCELSAYMASLAYEKDPVKLAEYFKTKCPQYTHFEWFAKADTEGFGFVHDGVGYIVMRGTKGWGDWMRNLNARFTRPDENLPAGWTGPTRHAGFAEGWNNTRDDIEAWVLTTPFANDPNFPFVFTGHSLGGALSFLGAWEFARRKRNVAAVITFGAARPGGKDFKEEYETLGLADRTLRLEFDQDIVPIAQGLVGYETVGAAWIPEKAPLLSEKTAAAAMLLSWLIASLGTNLFGKRVEDKPADAAKPASASQQGAMALSSDTTAKTDAETNKKFIRNSWREIMIRLVLLAAFSGVLALAAHKMQKRYALALSTMNYNRIRSRMAATLAETGAEMPHQVFLERAYQTLEHHLKELRGSTPSEPGPFGEIKGLPNRISSERDLEWLNTFHAGRIW